MSAFSFLASMVVLMASPSALVSGVPAIAVAGDLRCVCNVLCYKSAGLPAGG